MIIPEMPIVKRGEPVIIPPTVAATASGKSAVTTVEVMLVVLEVEVVVDNPGLIPELEGRDGG